MLTRPCCREAGRQSRQHRPCQADTAWLSQPCRWNCMNAAFMLYEQAGRGRGSGPLGGVGYPTGELDPGVEAQLVGDVRFDGALGQEKPGCDLAVAEVVGDEPGDVQLPAGEHAPRPGLDRRGRPGRLLVFDGEGSALVDRHRESTPEGRVESARAKTDCRQLD